MRNLSMLALSLVAAVTVATATPPTPANFQIFEDGSYKIIGTQYRGCAANQLCKQRPGDNAVIASNGTITATHNGIVYTSAR